VRVCAKNYQSDVAANNAGSTMVAFRNIARPL